MTRCTYDLSSSAIVMVLAWVSLAWPAQAHAQTPARAFPSHAKRAMFEVIQSPDILVDGAQRRLSPGARIRSPGNLLVMPATLTGQPLIVNYVSDGQGLVHDVWILSEAESSQKGPTTMPGAAGAPLEILMQGSRP